MARPARKKDALGGLRIRVVTEPGREKDRPRTLVEQRRWLRAAVANLRRKKPRFVARKSAARVMVDGLRTRIKDRPKGPPPTPMQLLYRSFWGLIILSVVTMVILVGSNYTRKPSQFAALAQPTPLGAGPQPTEVIGPPPEGQTNILLLGSDERGDGSFRTDVIILLTIDTTQGKVTAVSFPRDLWVRVPSLYEMKINQVYALGGFDALVGVFQDNFGVTPQYYAMTNFNGFVQFIDNRGGINVEVGQTLTDDCDLPQAHNGDCTVEPGTVYMDGKTALWYVRSRHTTSDIDRLRRAQEVVYAILKKSVSLKTVARWNEVKEELADDISTSLTIKQGLQFLPLAAQVLKNPDLVTRYAIGEKEASEFWSWNGMWILLPDEEAIKAKLTELGVRK